MAQKKSRNQPISAARKSAREIAEIRKLEQRRAGTRTWTPKDLRKKPYVQKIGTKVQDTQRILSAEAKRDRRKSRNLTHAL